MHIPDSTPKSRTFAINLRLMNAFIPASRPEKFICWHFHENMIYYNVMDHCKGDAFLMNDHDTTLAVLKEAVHRLCLRKGWGVEGVQNPQQVAMAMTVEMSELLEHFQWMNQEDVRALVAGEKPGKTAQIAEEFADVMMYGMQLARTLGIDVAHEVERKIDIVDHRPVKEDEPKR